MCTDSKRESQLLKQLATTFSANSCTVVNSDTSSDEAVQKMIAEQTYPHTLIISPSIIEAVSIPEQFFDV